MTAPTAGEDILASDFRAWLPQKKVKAVLTGRASTTTIAADPDLSITIPMANADYSFKAYLHLSSVANAAGDMQARFAWTIPSATVTYGVVAADTSLASGNVSGAVLLSANTRLDSTSPGAIMNLGCSTSGNFVVVEGHITVGSTVGDFYLEWAQFASNANESRVLEGSSLEVWQTYMQ